jgi:hypothetical protein
LRRELDELVRTGTVADAIRFPGGRALRYELQFVPGASWTASLDEQGIRVGIPKAQADRWIRPEEVGCQAEVALAGGETLSLLIEKDFPCLIDRPGEDDSDAFARPEDAQPPRC